MSENNKVEVYNNLEEKRIPDNRSNSPEEALRITLDLMDFYAKVRERQPTTIEKYGYDIDWITLT